MLSRQITERLSQFQTPFYLYDIELLKSTLQTAIEHANKYGYKIHYALKANFDDYLLRIIHSYGLGVDCVSGNEVKKAVEMGFNPQEIVFAGVGKSDEEIIYSIDNNIMAFNCESRQELQVINHFAKEAGKVVDIALRINPDIDPQTHQNISTGKADSKFGIAYSEIEQVAKELAELNNIRIIGLHFHIGSQITDLTVFENLCYRINSVTKWFNTHGFNIQHINAGGGLGVNYLAPESAPIVDFEKYFATFNKYLSVGDASIHFELGRSLICQCGELITKVLYNKETATGRKVVVVDASMTELLRPALYSAKHVIENLTPKSEVVDNYMVVGTVCESSDIFDNNVKLQSPQRGDLMTIKSAGAYGMSMASRYNLHELPKAVYSDQLL